MPAPGLNCSQVRLEGRPEMLADTRHDEWMRVGDRNQRKRTGIGMIKEVLF
jgi:hypothetical protein